MFKCYLEALYLIFQLDLGPLTVPLPIEFCELQLDGCPGATPACGKMNYGDNVQFCSSLQVPTASPDVSIINKSIYKAHGSKA